MTCNRRARQLLRKVDSHGYPITLTYRNKNTYQTSIGGIVTIISRAAILSFFFTLISNIVNKQKQVTFKQIYKSATINNQSYQLNLQNFDLAFGLQFNDGLSHLQEKQNIDKYFSLDFELLNSQFERNSEDQNVVVRTFTSLGYEGCNTSRFDNQTDVMASLGIDTAGWYCVKNLDLTLFGQMKSVNKQYLRLKVSKCSNSTNQTIKCASQQEIDSVMSLSTFGVAQLNSYFDQDEFDESPIKKDISMVFYNFQENQSFTQLYTVKKQMLTTKDSWLSNSLTKANYMYYEIKPSNVYVGSVKDNLYEMLTLIYACGDEEVMIERVVTSLVDVISLAGGFSSIIIQATGYIAMIYSGPLYYKKFLSKLYKISHNFKDKVSRKDLKKEIKEALKNKDDLLEEMCDSVMDRQQPKINTFLEQMKLYMVWNRGQPQTKNSIIYHNGVHLIEKSMDVMSLIKSVRKFKIAIKLLLSDYQYWLLPLMTKNLIPSKAKKQIIRKETNQTSKNHLRENLKSVLKHQSTSINQKIISDILYDDGNEDFCSSIATKGIIDDSQIMPRASHELGNQSSKCMIDIYEQKDVDIIKRSRRLKDKSSTSKIKRKFKKRTSDKIDIFELS